MPSSPSTRAIFSPSVGDGTPRRMRRTPAGFASGPRTLNTVRMPISLRTGPAWRIAGWNSGANMNPMPVSATHRATASGPRSMRTPSASRTSALPQALVAARFPCFATRPPAAAVTRDETVEMLKLFERSPPVPTMSIASSLTVTRTATSRSALAHPAISSTVSPRIASAASSAPSCAGVVSPTITEAIADRASSRVRTRPLATAISASRASIEFLQHAHAVDGHDRFRVELDRLERQTLMAKGHDDAIAAPRRDHELGGQRPLVDHQRVVARCFGRVGYAGEDPLAVVAHQRGLAVSRLGRTHHLRTESDGRALQAEADAERRNTALGRFPRERRGAPGDLRPPRAGRDHEPIDPRVERARQRGIVRAKDANVGAQRTKRLRQVVGEGVVVIDDQHATTRTRTSARLARRPGSALVTAPPSTSS